MKTTIKAISLWQPWASAWIMGIKKAETRHWAPKAGGQIYRGPLAVHAALTSRDPESGESLRDWFNLRLRYCERSRVLFQHLGNVSRWEDLPRGAILGIVWLDSVKRAEECHPDDFEQSWGNYSSARYIWKGDGVRFPTPIPCTGRQGLFNWEVPEEVVLDQRSTISHLPSTGVSHA